MKYIFYFGAAAFAGAMALACTISLGTGGDVGDSGASDLGSGENAGQGAGDPGRDGGVGDRDGDTIDDEGVSHGDADGEERHPAPAPGGAGVAGEGVQVSCTAPQGAGRLCTLFTEPEDDAARDRDRCTHSGGRAGTSCSTEGLVGCCRYSPTLEGCFYGEDDSAQQSACTAGDGAWSSSP